MEIFYKININPNKMQVLVKISQLTGYIMNNFVSQSFSVIRTLSYELLRQFPKYFRKKNKIILQLNKITSLITDLQLFIII